MDRQLQTAHSIADSPRFREALEALDLVVLVDVAYTETARQADYVLPAASQFEKWECTFFNTEFPRNSFQLRPPLLDPLPGTLPEPEIYARLIRALGVLEAEDRPARRRGRRRPGRLHPGVLRHAPDRPVTAQPRASPAL